MCQADQYERALAALGSLISGTKRSHGEKWQHAYEGMRVFLEVITPYDWCINSRGMSSASMHTSCSPRFQIASMCLRSVWTLQTGSKSSKLYM